MLGGRHPDRYDHDPRRRPGRRDGRRHSGGLRHGRDPSSGTGAVTALNGKANSGSSTWKVSVDGSAFTGALREKAINVGDTVALRLGA